MDYLLSVFFGNTMKIEHLIFDLDNTLYSPDAKMDAGITFRMMSCVAEFFGVSYEEGLRIREGRIKKFSTTLEWLRSEGLTDIETYFSKVHPENEADELEEDVRLRPLLESIEIPKIVHTNAPREHAERVLSKLKIRDLFDCVCDIRDCGLKGKPYPDAYRTALEKCGGNIDNTIFFDDLYKYTDGYAAMGGTAVLMGNKNGHHLDSDSSSAFKGVPPHPGRTLRAASIYDVPALLEQIKQMD